VGLPKGDSDKEDKWTAAFAPDAVVEDLFLAKVPEGPGAGVRAYLENKAMCDRLVIDRLSDGQESCGFTWHLEETGVPGQGIRGTTFVEVGEDGRITFLREICEPLYKPGDQTVELLKALGGDKVAKFGIEMPKRTPSGASDLCTYLWRELQGRAPIAEVLSFFAQDAVYEDFNYEAPLRGTGEVGKFLEKFAEITSLKFVAERFSDGSRACCFTWHVEIEGLPSDGPNIRGISFYSLNDDGLIDFVRDIPESAVKPPPLQNLAAMLRPKLRRFEPLLERSAEGKCDCNIGVCGPSGVEWATGEVVETRSVVAQRVVTASGQDVTIGELVGDAPGAVVIFLRHLG